MDYSDAARSATCWVVKNSSRRPGATWAKTCASATAVSDTRSRSPRRRPVVAREHGMDGRWLRHSIVPATTMAAE